jgi:hypothetical protein
VSARPREAERDASTFFIFRVSHTPFRTLR